MGTLKAMTERETKRAMRELEIPTSMELFFYGLGRLAILARVALRTEESWCGRASWRDGERANGTRLAAADEKTFSHEMLSPLMVSGCSQMFAIHVHLMSFFCVIYDPGARCSKRPRDELLISLRSFSTFCNPSFLLSARIGAFCCHILLFFSFL
jgi:hypothetical protein